jgi:NAD(P)-dependent dehydrogenase (short-subunit alcohol dehydrogenase family)
MVERTTTAWGTLSLVVNNAAMNRRKSSVLAGMDIWKSVVETNLIGAMCLTRNVLPHLVRHALISRAQGSETSSAMVYINTMLAHHRNQVLPGIAPVSAVSCAVVRAADVTRAQRRAPYRLLAVRGVQGWLAGLLQCRFRRRP